MRGLALSLAGLAILAGSIGLKAAAAADDPPIDDARLAIDAAARLRAAGFATRIERRPKGDQVIATRGACRMMVRNGDEWAVILAALEAAAAPYGPLRFAYRGAVSSRPPRIVPSVERIVQRELAALRIAMPRPALLAIGVTPVCAAPVAPLAGLAIYRRAAAIR